MCLIAKPVAKCLTLKLQVLTHAEIVPGARSSDYWKDENVAWFKDKQSKVLVPECEGATVFRNVGSYQPNDTA